MTIGTFTTQEEQEFIDLFNRFCEMSSKRFNLEITKVLYAKRSSLDTLRFNQIYTITGTVFFETEKAYKRRYFQMLTETMQEAIIKELK